jgi:uncharacterized protein
VTAPAGPPGPRFLYLHGFASGPSSTKGLAFAQHFGSRGVAIERLNLRLPSLERLRLSSGIAATRLAIGDERDRAVLIGSSLGGLTAARVAALDARVSALVLLAPAFCLSERWRARLGEPAFQRWRESGWLEIDDYVTREKARLDFGFWEDAAVTDRADGGWPDVRVPTLILHGRSDEVVGIELSRLFAADRRHVQLVELDDGHDLTATLGQTLQTAEAFLGGVLN